MKKLSKKVAVCIGIVAIIISVISFSVLNADTSNGESFYFSSTYGDDEVSLGATIWQQEDAEYAVLICPGYSCDRQKWKAMAGVFTANGMTVMTFDYSGQGGSSDTIGFDNAKTDNIPAEIYDAIEVLHEKSGIDYDHIILVGHSMGGRSVLRLIQDYNNPDAETIVTKQEIANVILIAPNVTYLGSTQGSLFAGTDDAQQEPWASFEEAWIEGTNIYLYGSTADDVVNDENILALYNVLGGDVDTAAASKGGYSSVTINSVGSQITVGVTSGTLHSYEMYSSKFVAFINEAIEDITGQESVYSPSKISLVYVGWFSALIGIFVLLMGLNMEAKTSTVEMQLVNDIPALTDSKAYLKRKLLMWIPGVVVAFVICCLCVVMPFGSPIMNIPYMCFIAGYGIAMAFFYRKGNFKGTQGKLPKPTLKTKSGWKQNVSCGVIVAAVIAFVWYVLWQSMYRLLPSNFRIFWLIVCGALMTVGYYVSGVEADMLDQAKVSRKTRVLYNLVQYVALFLFVGFYLLIGSYSGLVQQLVNVVLMYILCIPLGNFVRYKTSNRLYAAVITAVLFQLLMINSAALISMF